MSKEEQALAKLLASPVKPEQLELFAECAQGVISTNNKHLYALQLEETGSAEEKKMPVTAYDGTAVPAYSFKRYLERIAKYTQLPAVFFVLAFIYMDRIAATPRTEFLRRYGTAMKQKNNGNGGDDEWESDSEEKKGTNDAKQQPKKEDVIAQQAEKLETEGNTMTWWEDHVYLSDLNLHRMFLACLVTAIKFWSDKFYDNAVYGKIGGVSAEEMQTLEISTLLWLDFNLIVDENSFVTKHRPLDISHADSPRPSFHWHENTNMLPSLLIPTLVSKLSLLVDNDEIDFDSILADSPDESPRLLSSSASLFSKTPLSFDKLIEILATATFY